MASEISSTAPARRHSYTQMMAEPRFGPNDAYIAVMGMTGSGKSSLIALCCPEAIEEIGHAMESKTTQVKLYTFELEGRKVHLIDTPGFDDTHRSDTDVLKDLAYWLGLSYQQKKIQLTGLIYLHPISHVRMQGTANKNLRTFKALVGSGSMASVSLVSTMWSASSDSAEEGRYLSLKETKDYWKSMIDEGATAYRHTNDHQSAIKIIKPLLKKAPTVLNLQHEMVDEGKNLNNTEAGKEVDAGISLQREMLERKIEDTKNQMSIALAEKDQQWVDQLASDQEKYEQQVKDTRSAQEEMKSNMEKIFAEKEEQYKKSIDEINEKLKKAEEQHVEREKQYQEAREAARKDKELSDRKAAEQEEALNQAHSVAEEANTDKYMAQLAMIASWMEKREASEEQSKDEYQKITEIARLQKEE